MNKEKHNLGLIIMLLCLFTLGAEIFSHTAAAQEIRYGHIDFNEINQSNDSDSFPIRADESLCIEGVAVYGCHFGCDKINRLAREGVRIGVDSGNGYLNLEDGNILLHPEKDFVVGTSLGKIQIGHGAAIFVIKSGNSVVVYDLLQTKPKQVSVVLPTIINTHKILLEPGRMLVLTKQNTQNFAELEVDSHIVAYKNARLLGSYNGAVRAFIANFSITSALTTIKPLKRLTISDNRMDKLALERLVKGAVIMGDFDSIAEPVKIVLAQLRTNHSLQSAGTNKQQ